MTPANWQEYQQWLVANGLTNCKHNFKQYIQVVLDKLVAEGKLIRKPNGTYDLGPNNPDRD